MVEEADIIKMIENGGIKKVENSEDSLGKDLQMIAKELTLDENVYRFGRTEKRSKAYDALLGAIGDKEFYEKEEKPRYAFIKRFRYHLAVNNSAVNSEQANRFKELGSSLLGFKALLEYRSAGVNANGLEGDNKHNLLDKIKKG